MPQTLALTVLQMPYPDPLDSLKTLPATLWWPQYIAIDGAGLTAGVEFHGYRDSDAFLAWWGNKGAAQEIGVKRYSVGGAAFLQAYAGILGGTITLTAVVFGLAQTPDTPVLDTSGKSAVDAQGKPVLQPFFAGATTTTVSVPVATVSVPVGPFPVGPFPVGP